MQSTQRLKKAPRTVVIPAVFALGAVAAIGLRGNAGQPAETTPPIQPPTQALSMQNAFEQVANRLRPSVVYIKSRQAATSPAMRFQQGAFQSQDGGDGSN